MIRRLTRRWCLLSIASLLPAVALASGPYATTNVTREAFSQPLPQLPESLRDSFARGRSLFRQNWVIAPARDSEVDGLGPLYNRISCIACHAANGKGHAPDDPRERAGSLLVRLSVAGKDAHGGPQPHPVYGDQFNEASIPGVPAEGRVSVSWRSHQVTLAGGEKVSLRQPRLRFHELGYGPLGKVMTSARVGPPVFGLGLLEAVPEQTLLTLAQQAPAGAVRGRINRVYDVQSGQTVSGRFGLKANRSTLRDQIAAAMAGDLGITSTLMPHDGCMPAQTACLQAPHGGIPELSDQQLDDLTIYLSFLAPPAARDTDRTDVKRGAQLFKAAGCVACHRPQLPLAQHPLLGDLSGTEIAPYTDLLLHDMGPGLADGRPDYLANGRQWRTAPLWGAGLLRKMNERAGYLHDGRARNVQEAILWHGGEAQAARRRYMQLTAEERKALLAFIDAL